MESAQVRPQDSSLRRGARLDQAEAIGVTVPEEASILQRAILDVQNPTTRRIHRWYDGGIGDRDYTRYPTARTAVVVYLARGRLHGKAGSGAGTPGASGVRAVLSNIATIV